MSALIRPFIWLRRFRHRCGYGVHSPFAFEMITDLFYEKLPYYAYERLSERERREGSSSWRKAERKKVKRMLFRLVNRIQPDTVVMAGMPTAASIYLQEGCLKQQYTEIQTSEQLHAFQGSQVDFLYIHAPGRVAFAREVFHALAARTGNKSVFAVSHIHASDGMKRLWEEIKNDARTGITFDLYDIGIVFFDKERIKQHYLVNF